MATKYEIKETVIKAVYDIIGFDNTMDICLDDKINSFVGGNDSLNRMMIKVEIETAFLIDMSDVNENKWETIQDICDSVEQSLNSHK